MCALFCSYALSNHCPSDIGSVGGVFKIMTVTSYSHLTHALRFQTSTHPSPQASALEAELASLKPASEERAVSLIAQHTAALEAVKAQAQVAAESVSVMHE